MKKLIIAFISDLPEDPETYYRKINDTYTEVSGLPFRWFLGDRTDNVEVVLVENENGSSFFHRDRISRLLFDLPECYRFEAYSHRHHLSDMERIYNKILSTTTADNEIYIDRSGSVGFSPMFDLLHRNRNVVGDITTIGSQIVDLMQLKTILEGDYT